MYQKGYLTNESLNDLKTVVKCANISLACVKNDLNLRINTNCTVIWYLIICLLLFLSWGDSVSLYTRVDSWKEKWIRLLEKGKAVTVLGILPSTHIVSVRICIESLCRKQMETEVSLHPSAYGQNAGGEVLMWKPARTYKRSTNFECKESRRKVASWSFLFPSESIESLWKVLNWQTKLVS